MKIISKINPKRLLRSKESRSVSRSEPSSFGSGSGSTSSDSKGTPTSVLPENSGDWSEISGDMYSDLVQAFKMMDKDGDGKITRKQLEAVLSRVGAEPPSEEELKLMLSEVDGDGDGCISLEEFSAIGSAFAPPACDAELKEAFQFFDANHDGLITADELHSVFASLGDDRCTLDDCRRMISVVDKNGDGFVCFEDFARMMELQR